VSERPEIDGVLLCDDMIFASRITGTARALGLTISVVASLDTLKTETNKRTPSGVILDLALAGNEIERTVIDLRQSPASPRIVAYGSHVDTDTLRAARSAGCDVVLPRSKFVEELPVKLSEWLAR
jgi:DNA-binding NarL/FixJ family response regulator